MKKVLSAKNVWSDLRSVQILLRELLVDASEMQKIKSMPTQAQTIVEYIRYMSEYVTELNEPTPQLQYLDTIFQQMKQEFVRKEVSV